MRKRRINFFKHYESQMSFQNRLEIEPLNIILVAQNHSTILNFIYVYVVERYFTVLI